MIIVQSFRLNFSVQIQKIFFVENSPQKINVTVERHHLITLNIHRLLSRL